MNKSSSQRLVSSLFLGLLLSITPYTHSARAQDLDTVTVAGRITDQDGAVLPRASVQLTLLKNGVARSVTSDGEGRYRIVQVAPGDYKLSCSSDGFAPVILEVSGSSGQSLHVDVTLRPAEMKVDPVVVVANETPSIDTKRTVVGATLGTREFETLPLITRSPLDLIFTLPGVTEEPLSTRDLAEDRNSNASSTPEEAGSFSLSGAPAYSNNLTIDGLDNNDDRAARERFQPSLDAIEEVQVITNQFSAEYGRASGGRVNLRTRGGSTEFHGRCFYYFRDEALNANTFRNNSLGLTRLPLQEHDGGFTFSGPARIPGIKQRSKILFFTSLEQDRVLDSALIDTLVPVAQSSVFPIPLPTTLVGRRLENANEPALSVEVAPFISSVSTPVRNTTLLARGDYNLTQMHNVTFVYQFGQLINLRQFGGGNRLAEALQGKRRSTDAFSISDSYVFSGHSVNQLRIQFSRLTPALKTLRVGGPVVLIALNDSLPAGDDGRRTGTLVAGSSTSGASDRREGRWQLQNVLSYERKNHSLKFGGDVHYVKSDFIDLSDLTGTFNFASAGDFLAGVPSRFRQTFQATSTQRNIYSGLFVQDEWQLIPQMLFSYGLRYERETIVNDQNNFGPRASLAYSPLKSGIVVVRFGAGLFYNRALLRTIDDFTLGKQQLFFDTNTLTDPTTGKLLSSAQRRLFIAQHLRFPETSTANSLLVKQYGQLNSQFSRRLDRALRIPESYQFNLGIEQQLGRGYFVEANFTATRALHLWREFNQNAPRLPDGYKNFSEFLSSRDFANFVNATTGSRPLYAAGNAGELVRFVMSGINRAAANSMERVMEFGVPVSIVDLNSPTSTTALDVALAAISDLRPDPSRGEVEELVSAGNSFYRAMTIELKKQFVSASDGAIAVSFRAGYTLSSLVDDGVVNTSDALTPGDFRSERARSLLDRRHRFVFSGTVVLPRTLGALQFSPVLRLASEAPFNISLGGNDRNLDDVGNDRPNFAGDKRSLHWRAPGDAIDNSLITQFSQPMIGQSGNLPRNAGRGPGLFMFDLNVTRDFRLKEGVRMRAMVEFDNVLNRTVFSFGSEFINFNALSPSASAQQRQAFEDSFLLATHTLRPRQLRIGLRLQF